MLGIIIAGGIGSRLLPLTTNRPKHLLPVANRPFLEYQVALLRRHDIRQIVLATSYMADLIAAHFGDGSAFGVEISYAVETVPLGTGGAVRNAAAGHGDEPLLVLNGDILTDGDLTALRCHHTECGGVATIAVAPAKQPHAFGVIRVGQDSRVNSWNEPSEEAKRIAAAAPLDPNGYTDTINAGIYVLNPEVLDSVDGGRPVSLEREMFPPLLQSARGVYAFAINGFWLDMGRPAQYIAANQAVVTGTVSTDVQFAQIGARSYVSNSAYVDETSVIGADCSVGAGSRVIGSVLMDGVTVGNNCTICGAIGDTGSTFAEQTEVGPGHVAAAGARVGPTSLA